MKSAKHKFALLKQVVENIPNYVVSKVSATLFTAILVILIWDSIWIIN
jgi:hypothetical protein